MSITRVFAAVALLAGVVLIARTRRRAPPEPPSHVPPEAPPDEPRPAGTLPPLVDMIAAELAL